MKQRLLSAFFGILLFAAVMALGTGVFDAAVLIITEIAIYEITAAVGADKKCAAKYISYMLPVFLLIDVNLSNGKNMGVIAFLYLAVLMTAMLIDRKNTSFDTVCRYFTIVLYVSIAFSYVSLTRHMGLFSTMIIFIGCWVTDSFAYFAGVFFGKHKLAPVISPKKTVEGSIGGILGVTAVTMAYGALLSNIFGYEANLFNAAIMGAVCGVVSQLGDLCASVIKREHKIKDYGNIMPGHGGVMDRFDSIIFVAPAVYYLMSVLPVCV